MEGMLDKVDIIFLIHQPFPTGFAIKYPQSMLHAHGACVIKEKWRCREAF